MYIKPECIGCLIDRGIFECKLALNDEKTQIECMRKFCEILVYELKKNFYVTPSYLGTFRDRIIKNVSKNDYYKALKEKNNRIALSIVNELESRIKKENLNNDEKLKFLIKCAIAGNAAEYGVKGNKYMEDVEKFKESFFEILKKDFDCDKALMEIKNAKKILYLADNNGEIVFDAMLINFLIFLNKDVTLAIKGENVMDDFSFDDLENFKEIKFNLPKEKIISCGNFVGQYFESAPKEFLETLKNSDLVIAKGMANFETLNEEYKKFKINKRTLYLLTVKCEPIAHELNVERYSLVAKVI